MKIALNILSIVIFVFAFSQLILIDGKVAWLIFLMLFANNLMLMAQKE